MGPGQTPARHQGPALADVSQGRGLGEGPPSLPWKGALGPWRRFGVQLTYWSKTRGQRRAGEAPAMAATVSVMPQVEEAHAGGGLFHRDRDEVGSDVGDKDMLEEAAGGLPVLAGLHRHRQVLLSTGC